MQVATLLQQAETCKSDPAARVMMRMPIYTRKISMHSPLVDEPFDDVMLAELLQGEGVFVQDFIRDLGFDSTYLGDSLWRIDSATYDADDVLVFLKSQPQYSPIMLEHQP